MISKECFCNALNNIKEQMDSDAEFAEFTKKFDCLENGFYYNNDKLFDAAVDALSGGDSDIKDWISWFILYADFGRSNCNKACLDKVTYNLTSCEKFYDFLVLYKKSKF